MSSLIVLPPLDIWAKERLTALIDARSQTDFDAAFNSFIAEDVSVVLNGVSLTRAQYKQQLQGERLLEESASVVISNTVVSPLLNSSSDSTQDSGVVGLFFNATYVETIRVFAAAAEHKQTSTLNIKVEQVGPAPIQPVGVKGGGTDRRRVVELNQVSIDTSVKITPPTGIVNPA